MMRVGVGGGDGNVGDFFRGGGEGVGGFEKEEFWDF